MERDGKHILSQPGKLLPRPIWYRVWIALLFTGLLFVWLLIRPASDDVVVSVDNLAQAASFLVAILLCFNDLVVPKQWRRVQSPRRVVPEMRNRAQRWIPRLFGLIVISAVLGQLISLYYTQVLQIVVPSPSLADVCNLSAYVFLILCLLLLPANPLARTTRFRIFIDSLMIIVAVITFSWYFLLGPRLLNADETVLARIVQLMYPLADLALILCVCLLLSHTIRPSLRPAVLLFSLAFILLAITDSITNYQSLNGTYAVGELIDVCWPFCYILIGVAVKAVRLTSLLQPGQAAASDSMDDAPGLPAPTITLSLWRSFLPYMLIPETLLLIIYVWQTSGRGTLALGVYFGGIGLIGLVMLRQSIAMKEAFEIAQETKRLNRELHVIQDELQEKNHALSEANVRLASLATTDPLTGLPNHRSLFQHLEKELERARRHDRPFSLMFFDGDRFKRVNDTYGHAVGDAVLRELGERVGNALRGGDTLGRYGGEEFLILLPETDLEEARQVAERIRASVATSPLALSHVEGGLNMTISIGLAAYPLDGSTSGELVQNADQAMYWAKRLGRNQVRTCEEALRASDDETLSATVHMLDRREGPLLDGMSGDQEQHAAQLTAVYSLMWLLELRDHGISMHSYHVSDLATAIAVEMGLDAQHVFDVSTSALLHDIGKIAIPDALLQKKGRLSPNEWSLIRQHAELGAQVLEVSPALRHLMPVIRHHHECWDGSGYPDSLAGEAIPLEARIISVAEAYSAMLSDRPYQSARSNTAALTELQRCAGQQFDPAVVRAMLAVCHHLPEKVEQQKIAESVA